MAVNISAHQIHGPGLDQDVWEALRDAGLDPATLVLEITESAMPAYHSLRPFEIRYLTRKY